MAVDLVNHYLGQEGARWVPWCCYRSPIKVKVIRGQFVIVLAVWSKILYTQIDKKNHTENALVAARY